MTIYLIEDWLNECKHKLNNISKIKISLRTPHLSKNDIINKYHK